MNSFCFWGNIYNSFHGRVSGGGELQLSIIIKELSKLEYKIFVVDTQVEEDIIENNISFISIKNRYNAKKGFKKFWRLYYLYRCQYETKADIYGGRIRSSLHLLSIFASQRNNAKFILWIASDLDTLNTRKRYKYFYRYSTNAFNLINHFIHSEIFYQIILRSSNLIITQHENQKTNLLLKGISCVVTIPNLFDFQSISGFDSKSILFDFVIVGSFDKRKGVIELQKLAASNRNLRIALIGNSRDASSQKILDIISKYQHITIFNKLDHEKTLYYIKNSRGLISLSKMEGFPNVFLEAWALGKPVFSLNVNPGDIINKNGLGKYFHGNIDSLNEYLKYYKDQFDQSNSIQYVKEYHDPKRNIAKLITNIDEVH